ncbi:MAG TPA: retropepsin-like aspartic protease [Acidobacteriaceae bacterium]|jgi:predicted aspartyl protease
MNLRRLTQSTIYSALLLLLAVSGPQLRAAQTVPFKLAQDALILVPVTANGQGPFYFLLDTGADVSIVDTTLARKLALPTLQSAHLITMNGSQTVGVSRLASLSIGDVQVNGLPVFEKDLSCLHRINGKIAGVLGQDFLSAFNYLLDYKARSLRFEEKDDLRDELDGDEVPIQSGENRMIIAAEAEFRGHADVHLLLDSGTNLPVLFGPVSNQLHCLEDQQGFALSSTGETPIRIGEVDLTVASHVFRDVLISLATDTPPQPVGDGLLPMSLFDAIYVNNHQSFVMLNPHTRQPTSQATAGGSQKTIHADR